MQTAVFLPGGGAGQVGCQAGFVRFHARMRSPFFSLSPLKRFFQNRLASAPRRSSLNPREVGVSPVIDFEKQLFPSVIALEALPFPLLEQGDGVSCALGSTNVRLNLPNACGGGTLKEPSP